MNKQLAAKVEAYNAATSYAQALHSTLIATFRPLVGTKVIKADGTLLAKVEKLMPKLPCTAELIVYKSSFADSLKWAVRTSRKVEGNDYYVYQEVSVYVGKLKGDTLDELYEKPPSSKTYTVEEVEYIREHYKAVKRIADEARSKLGPFGEYDQ